VMRGGSSSSNSDSRKVRAEQNEATPAKNDAAGSTSVSSPLHPDRPPTTPTKSRNALTSDLLSAQGVCSPRDLLAPTHRAVGSRPLSPKTYSPARHQLDIEWPAPCKVCAPSLPQSVTPAHDAPAGVESKQDSSQLPESNSQRAPKLGPPPRRPTKRPGLNVQPRSQCLSPFPVVPILLPGSPSRGGFLLGLPPLNLPLPSPPPLPVSAGGDVTPTRPRSPKRTEAPQTSPRRTRFGWSSTHVHGIYSRPARSTIRTTSPRTRLGRKSLTRIANRVASGFLKVNGPSNGSNDEVSEAGEADGSGDELSPTDCRSPVSPEGEQACFSSPGPHLQAQIWSEVRRRRSRARPGTPTVPPQIGVNGPWSSPCPGFWADLEGLESPVTPVKVYPLTPVKEQGETPYRLADWQNTPT
jgi:hypothetical protein